MIKKKPDEAKRLVDDIIRNTYRTLLTRGQKGCFVYCTDEALAAYLKSRIGKVQEYIGDEFFKSDLYVAEKKDKFD